MPYHRFNNIVPTTALSQFISKWPIALVCLTCFVMQEGTGIAQSQTTGQPRGLNSSDIAPLGQYPISPNANDVWEKESRNQFLRFVRNSVGNGFESYRLNVDQTKVLTVSQDFVVGFSVTPDSYLEDIRNVLVPGKISPDNSIEFESESRLILSDTISRLQPSSFGNGLFCCFLEHYTADEGVGSHEVMCIQLVNAGDKSKLEVKDRLEFGSQAGEKFLFQASRKNTLVLLGTLWNKPSTVHFINVRNDGTLADQSIKGFENELKTRGSYFRIDVSEDGRWLATTEASTELDTQGELAFAIGLSEIEDGRIKSQHAKHFSVKPIAPGPGISPYYYMDIPIRFISNNTLLIATPIGWGRLEFGNQGVSSAIDNLTLNPYPTNPVCMHEHGMLHFCGIIENKGNWFAVRSHEFISDQVVLWGRDSLVRIP